MANKSNSSVCFLEESTERQSAFRFYLIFKTIYLNSERSEQFLKQNAVLTYSWRFLRSNELEQLEFKLEKLLGFRNLLEKLENESFFRKYG